MVSVQVEHHALPGGVAEESHANVANPTGSATVRASAHSNDEQNNNNNTTNMNNPSTRSTAQAANQSSAAASAAHSAAAGTANQPQPAAPGAVGHGVVRPIRQNPAMDPILRFEQEQRQLQPVPPQQRQFMTYAETRARLRERRPIQRVPVAQAQQQQAGSAGAQIFISLKYDREIVLCQVLRRFLLDSPAVVDLFAVRWFVNVNRVMCFLEHMKK